MKCLLNYIKELDMAKKQKYYKNTQNEMIRDLLRRGLKDFKNEMASEVH